MEAQGWIRLHRQFLGSRLFSRSGNTVKVALYIMLSANHRSGFVRGIEIKRGQCVRSLTQISDACGVSRKAARYAVAQMRTEGFISVDEPFGAQQGHRFSVANYDLYQAGEDDRGTGGLHEGVREGTTNKNKKNKEKTPIVPKGKRFIPPSLKEVIEYNNLHAATKNKQPIDAEAFLDHYTAKDWMIGKNKMKDWKAAVRTWFKDQPPATTDSDPLAGYLI
jgi:hypothetical protein